MKTCSIFQIKRQKNDSWFKYGSAGHRRALPIKGVVRPPQTCWPTLHVSFDEGREHAVFLLQEGLGFVVLQNISPLHHNDQISCEDGVNAVLETKANRVHQQD